MLVSRNSSDDVAELRLAEEAALARASIAAASARFQLAEPASEALASTEAELDSLALALRRASSAAALIAASEDEEAFPFTEASDLT